MTVDFATGLRATVQSLGWLGVRSGILTRHGLDIACRGVGVSGPAAVAGMLRGDWEFCETGTVPVVQGVLKGRDPVILLVPSSPQIGSYIMARPGIRVPADMSGAKIAVLSDTGQHTVAASMWLRGHGVTATLVAQGSFEREYDALVTGSVDAAFLPVDFRFRAERDLGATLFPIATGMQGAVVACTQRLIDRDRDLIARIVLGYIETIHWFKTQPASVVPLLAEFLQFTDEPAVAKLHAFYADTFQARPRPDEQAIRTVLMELGRTQPEALTLPSAAVVDTSFLDELEMSGFVEHLYA